MMYVLSSGLLIGHSRKASTSSGTNEDSQGVPTNPPESASPCPGSSSWVYVDEPLSSVGHNFCLCLFSSSELKMQPYSLNSMQNLGVILRWPSNVIYPVHLWFPTCLSESVFVFVKWSCFFLFSSILPMPLICLFLPLPISTSRRSQRTCAPIGTQCVNLMWIT